MSKIILIALSLLAYSNMSQANGKLIQNGGDICEARIKDIRNDIKDWILRGDSSQLELPENLSLEDYNEKMLIQINEAKISCTDEKIIVHNAEKTCGNGDGFIVCNIGRLNKHTKEADQYPLVHHEYAGLAGLETNNGSAESSYFLSDQLSAQLEYVKILKLKIAQKHEFIPVCERHISVRFAIKNALRASHCVNITKKDVAKIKKLKVSTLFSGNNSLNAGDLSGLRSLTHLNLITTEEVAVSENLLHSLKNLTELSLRIPSPLPKKFLHKLYKLKQLKVRQTLFQLDNGSIPKTQFDDLISLEVLHLWSLPQVSVLDKDIFKNLNNLKEIDFRALEYLTSVPNGLFRNQSNLEKLYLSNLNIVKLPSLFFKVLNNLKSLYMYEVTRFNNFHWDMFYFLTQIEELSILKADIHQLDFTDLLPFKKLKTLDVSRNIISYVDNTKALNKLTSLEAISMKENYLNDKTRNSVKEKVPPHIKLKI